MAMDLANFYVADWRAVGSASVESIRTVTLDGMQARRLLGPFLGPYWRFLGVERSTQPTSARTT